MMEDNVFSDDSVYVGVFADGRILI